MSSEAKEEAETAKVASSKPSDIVEPEEVTTDVTSQDQEEPAEEGESSENGQSDHDDAPPLPDEAPPLPAEAPPAVAEEDDGWAPVWEDSVQAFYFYNRFTGATQWDNPRIPEASVIPPVLAPALHAELPPAARPAGGYDPAIHGDYDENAWYAQPAEAPVNVQAAASTVDPYAATAAFNRFTGRFQAADITPENYNDENKSKRQMNAFFDVDAAANNHDGRSLKEERSTKKISKQELKQFKEKRKAKKEEKRRAWLRD